MWSMLKVDGLVNNIEYTVLRSLNDFQISNVSVHRYDIKVSSHIIR